MNIPLKLLITFAIIPLILAKQHKIMCYINYDSVQREVSGTRFDLTDLEKSFNVCSHIVLGFHRIPNYFDTNYSNPYFEKVATWKRQYPKVKFLLGIGGENTYAPRDYIAILYSLFEQNDFLIIIMEFIVKFQFDGLDLTFQFPRKSANTFVQSADEIDYIAKYRNKFTEFIEQMHNEFKEYDPNLLLTLSILPYINEEFFDATALNSMVDLISFTAYKPSHFSYTSIGTRAHFAERVNKWLNQGVPNSKIIIGIPNFAHSDNSFKCNSDLYKNADNILINYIKEQQFAGIMLVDANLDLPHFWCPDKYPQLSYMKYKLDREYFNDNNGFLKIYICDCPFLTI